ncbi:MAG: hypothetical protein J6J33_05635 [Clostridia bacterium]|nr:hypothetical protein [Clostridia bacterium]
MDKKSVSASILVLYLTLVFSVIGICFSMFVYKDTRVLVTSALVKNGQGVEVFSDEELSEKVTQLKLSNMDTGLKPATGEVDSETQIPSTITDTGTSEGYYSTVYVKCAGGFKVNLKDIKIETKKDKVAVSEQKKNIFVAIKDVKNAVKTLEKEDTIASFENVNETQKLTFYIWIGALASEDIEGAKISLTFEFLAV